MYSPDTLESQVKSAIVRCLKMPIAPDDIGDDMPLFGEGLGLDSIDALELVIGIEKTFGVKIQDEEVGAKAFTSVNALVEFMRSKGVSEGA